MAKLKTDSPLSRRIARAFVEFLDSVEPASGVDFEGIEVARECLNEAFKLNSSSTGDDQVKTDSLIDIFTSLEVNDKNQALKSGPTTRGVASTDAPSSSSAQNVANRDGETNGSSGKGVSSSTDELFGLFFSALEKNDFFTAMPDGSDDPDELEKATVLFHDLIHEMEKSECQVYNRNTMAEALKAQGNKAMQSKLYSDAINLYSLAIALIEDNAVYCCNRAAAYTPLNRYAEAIRDCLKSIEIDPNYSKAYSRLGLAYYAQGNYHDALEKGFKKALALDPSNTFVKENIRVSEQRLRERQQWFGRERDQNTSSSHGPQSTRGPALASDGSSTSFSYAMPAEVTNIIGSLLSNATPGQPSPRQQQGEDVDGQNDSGINGNISFNFGEPGDFSGALRSMMGMFSGGNVNVPQGNPPDNTTTANGSAPPPNGGDSQNNPNGRSTEN